MITLRCYHGGQRKAKHEIGNLMLVFRANVIGFVDCLVGTAPQSHFELHLALALRTRADPKVI